MYDLGTVLEQNSSEAMKWYRRAADLGYSGAQYNIGYNYQYGIGVKQDYKKPFNGISWQLNKVTRMQKTALVIYI